MNKFKKRCLSTALGLIMAAVNTLSCFSSDVFGNVSTPTAQVASTSNAQANSLSAIGIDTTKAPEGFDEYDDISNPYGTNVMTPKPVSELLIADDESGSSFKLYGHNKSYSVENKKSTFLENPIESEDDIFFNSSSFGSLNLPENTYEYYADNSLVSGGNKYCAVVYRKFDGNLYLGVRGENEDTAENDICIKDSVTDFPLGYNLCNLSGSSKFDKLGYGGALICIGDRIVVFDGKYLKAYSYENGSLKDTNFKTTYDASFNDDYLILLLDKEKSNTFYAFSRLNNGNDSAIKRYNVFNTGIEQDGSVYLNNLDLQFYNSPFFDISFENMYALYLDTTITFFRYAFTNVRYKSCFI